MKLKEAMEKKRKGMGGFTLIELMIVVAIIAILAAIAIPNFLRARYKANLQACKQSLGGVKTGYELAIDEYGSLQDDPVVGSEDDICQMIIPGYEDPADCAGMVTERVEETCKAGTFKSAPTGDYLYEIKGTAKDKQGTVICVTETKITENPPDDCVHAAP